MSKHSDMYSTQRPEDEIRFKALDSDTFWWYTSSPGGMMSHLLNVKSDVCCMCAHSHVWRVYQQQRFKKPLNQLWKCAFGFGVFAQVDESSLRASVPGLM